MRTEQDGRMRSAVSLIGLKRALTKFPVCDGRWFRHDPVPAAIPRCNGTHGNRRDTAITRARVLLRPDVSTMHAKPASDQRCVLDVVHTALDCKKRNMLRQRLGRKYRYKEFPLASAFGGSGKNEAKAQ